MSSTEQPRRIIRYAATGESMPPDSRHATRPPCRSAARRRPAPCRRSRTPGPAASRREWSAPDRRDPRASPCASLMRPPTSRSICGEVNGKRLSARRALTRNDAGCAIAEVAENRRRERVEVVRRPAGVREVRDAEHARDRARAPRPTTRPAPSSISMRPITDRTRRRRGPQRASAGCAPAPARTTAGSCP